MDKVKKNELGRGAVGKTAVAGSRDRATNRVDAEVVERIDTTTLTDIVSGRAEHGATVFTDKWKAYKPLEKTGYEHSKVKHSVGRYVDGMAHTNESESFCSMMKRGCQGTYLQVPPEGLHRHVAEFRGRYNQWPIDMLHQMGQTVRSDTHEQTTYGGLIANGPHTRRRMEEMVA